MKIRNIVIINVLIFVIGVFGIFTFVSGSHLWKDHEIKLDEQKRKELYNMILNGASIKPEDITINYAKPISTGSPLIFGGAEFPDWHADTVWDKLQQVGATSMRTDFYLENMVPYNTTINDYKKNKNDVSNPDTWRRDFIKGRQDAFNNAKIRGMKTIGIVSYAPSWLTYSHTTHGVPIDWNIYEDLVKKAYSIYRDNIDYIEIWNEPNDPIFLDITNSGLTQSDAYTQIFYHAAKAVREVDQEKNDGKRVLIGGPVGNDPNDTTLLESILKNENTKKYIGFISYHNYVMDEPSWDNYKAILKQYNMEHYPLFITEWNYNPKEKENSPFKTGYPALLYTSNKLIDFLKMGAAGANYFSFLQEVDNEPNKNTEYLGFYKWNMDHIELLPQARSWQILSSDLALGSGKSKIYSPIANDTDINSIGFINSNNEQGLAIVNQTPSLRVINIHFNNLSINSYAHVLVYFASEANDGNFPIYRGTLKVENNKSNFIFYIPGETVMGVKLAEEKDWFNLFNLSH